MQTKIKLGISSCLLGERVRYDGGHKLNHFLKYTLGKYVEYIPVCPEVELGLGTPREPLHLIGNPNAPRLVTTQTNQDYTEQMIQWANKRVSELEKDNLYGFIFKSKSPSSGMKGIKVYNKKGAPPVKKGVGLFAKIFMEHFPLIPVEDERHLRNPTLRENFIERIFTYSRWRKVLEDNKSRDKLTDFHTKHKLLILSHSPRHHRIMEKLVAQAKDLSLPELYKHYQLLLMESLHLKATPKKHVNVLRHIIYHLKHLSTNEKQELMEFVERYRKSDVPLIVPITLANHYIRKYGQHYFKEQYYLNPDPLELQLRNHA